MGVYAAKDGEGGLGATEEVADYLSLGRERQREREREREEVGIIEICGCASEWCGDRCCGFKA